MKTPRIVILILVTGCFLLVSPMTASSQNIAVYPLSWDFGNVIIGEEASKVFTIESIGPSTLQLVLAILTSEEAYVQYTGDDFYFLSAELEGVPLTLGPYDSYGPADIEEGSSVDIDLAYAPTSAGFHHAELLILSNDHDPPGDSEIFVHLGGNGINPAVPVPATILLFGSGLLGLAGFRKKSEDALES